MVSKFFWKKKNVDEDSLDQFYKFCKQHVMVNIPIHSINNKSVCDYFIRYENLEEDIINLCKKLKITDYDIKYLPTHKKGCRGKNDGYRKFYINKKIILIEASENECIGINDREDLAMVEKQLQEKFRKKFINNWIVCTNIICKSSSSFVGK